MVGANALWISGKAQSASGISLRITINQQRPNLCGSKGRCKIDCSSGLSHSAFLVRNSDYYAHKFFEGSTETVPDEFRRVQNESATPQNGALFYVEQGSGVRHI